MSELEEVSSADVGSPEEDFENYTPEQLEAMYNDTMRNFKEGEIISGVIVGKDNENAYVDIGFKSEGIVPLHEFPIVGIRPDQGSEIEVLIEETENDEGVMVFSAEKAHRQRKWAEIHKKCEGMEIVRGTIFGRIKGGLAVDIGLRAFLPGSQIDLRPPRNVDDMIGKEYDFRIIKMNQRRGNIVLSRRVLIEEERKITKTNTLATLEENKLIEGIVKNITDYGAFIDLGGIDGLLHITDMSWGRINHPSEMLNIGDNVDVMVLKFDKENERVSLGLKQKTPDPWEKLEEKYPVDHRIKGKVVSVTDYGAFLELENGVEGLIHISEMSWSKHVRHPSRIMSVGDEVEAQVLNIEKEKKRISLGIKQITPNPWENIEERYPIASVVEGIVRNLTDFGAFVEIEDGVDGLIHISDMSWTRKIKHPSESVKKKDQIKCKVLKIDKDNERISLGLKQLEPDPWQNVEEKYKVGEDVSVIITKTTNFGAFAELEPGVEGLIHVSQIADKHVKNAKKQLKVDQEVQAKIIKVEPENKKIGLSIKALHEGFSQDDVDLDEIEDFPEEE